MPLAAWYVLFLQAQWKAVPQFSLCISAAFGQRIGLVKMMSVKSNHILLLVNGVGVTCI